MGQVMIVERPDLDGSRVVEAGSPNVWLIFHGRRHRIPSPEVYENLFSETDALITVEAVDIIARGPDLSDGAMLIRAVDGTSIYFLTAAYEGGVRRHHIPNYESFLEFGFDMSKVREFPVLLVDALSTGRDITGAHAPGR
jgi:hypothetical protein